MYYENDNFSPTEVNDWNIDSHQLTARNIPVNMYKKVNSHLYAKYSISLNKKAKTKLKTDFHTSPYYNRPIYDAVTGTTIRDHVVGSKYEDLYFKISGSDVGIGQEGAIFFYHTPYEYERHNSTLLNPEIKIKWEKKYNNAKYMLNNVSEDE
jgi:hypothetical protein